MPRLSLNDRPSYQSLLRVGAGVAIALILYHLAVNFATADCASLQSQLRQGGPRMLGRLLLAGTLAALLGMPSSVVAVAAGVLTGPFIGIPVTSISIALGSIIPWTVGRLYIRGRELPKVFDDNLEKRPWFQHMMNQRPGTGYNWTAVQGLVAPVPYPLFGFIVATKVPHLNFRSFLAGIFVSSLLHSAGYSLAGASIGCAVVNQSLGASIEPYRTLIVISCLILVVLSRIQSLISEKSSHE